MSSIRKYPAAKRILIVEDHMDIRKLLKMTLEFEPLAMLAGPWRRNCVPTSCCWM